MASNVEIKARAVDFQRQLRLAAALATRGPEHLGQRDTFFRCHHGRLKLREFGDGRCELIQYRRADRSGPARSCYERLPVAAPEPMRRALGRALGIDVVVHKQRTVYWVGRTRIHLDRVRGLGEFLELEVVLAPGDDPAAGSDEAEALARALEIAPAHRIAVAYADLLRASGPRPGAS